MTSERDASGYDGEAVVAIPKRHATRSLVETRVTSLSGCLFLRIATQIPSRERHWVGEGRGNL